MHEPTTDQSAIAEMRLQRMVRWIGWIGTVIAILLVGATIADIFIPEADISALPRDARP